MTRQRFLMWAFLALCGLVRPALAASLYSPNIAYRTLYSPRFAVHYPPHAFNLAVRISRLAEDILRIDAELLHFSPSGTIDIVLTDSQDDANGSAEVLPHNCLRLFLAAPTELTGLASYDDWLRILLTHELAHIVDIDHTAGLTRGLRYVFGKTISLNGSVPQYLSEGVAVYTETKLTPFGRGRSSYVDMVLRMAALGGRFVKLDQAHILYADYPFGSAAYFYGGRFHLYLSERLGNRAVADLHAWFAAQPLPWLYLPGALSVFGRSLSALWRDFADYETRIAVETADRLRREGLTRSVELYAHRGDLLGARYSKDASSIVFTRVSPSDGSTTRRLLRTDARGHARPRPRDVRLFRDTACSRFALERGHGDDFVYSMASITHRFDGFNDLMLYDASRGRRLRLYDKKNKQQSLRARDPAVSPDGRRLVFVQTSLHQSWLSWAPIERDEHGRLMPALDVHCLVAPSGDMQQASPAFHPDGKLLAVSTFFPGGHRDIVLLDSETGALVRRITNDDAQDGNPTFSPDGRYLLFESDNDGISNIYAYELSSGAYFRLTRVVGGAFQADVSPDGSTLLFRQAIAGGFALHEMPFAPNAFERLTYDAELGYRPAQPAQKAMASQDTAEQAWHTAPWPLAQWRADEPLLALRDTESAGPYAPSRGLVINRDNWLLLPSLFAFNANWGLSLTTFAQDSLHRHTWQLTAGALLHVNRPNLSLSYVNDVWLPTLTAAGGYNSVQYNSQQGRIIESSATGTARMSLAWRRRHQANFTYGFEHRQIQGGAALGLPSGRFVSLALSYRYGFARNFPYSISYETGRSIGVGVQQFTRILGSQHDQLVVSVDARGFVNNPLLHNHVLAVRVVGNWAFGRDSAQKYFLYGHQANSFFTSQSARLLGLRGFVPGGKVGAPAPGDGVLALYGEYRFPVWHIQRGIFGWPIYFEHLHVALFTDLGNTFGRSAAVGGRAIDATFKDVGRHLWLGSGLEVRLDVALSWAVPLTVRLGVAEPMLARGVSVAGRVAPSVYVDVGSTF